MIVSGRISRPFIFIPSVQTRLRTGKGGHRRRHSLKTEEQYLSSFKSVNVISVLSPKTLSISSLSLNKFQN